MARFVAPLGTVACPKEGARSPEGLKVDYTARGAQGACGDDIVL